MSSHVKKAKGKRIKKPNWLELPIDLTKNILQRLDTVEIVTSARNVCPLWWNICKDPLMWRTIDMSSFHIIRFNRSCLDQICRCAIDLSSSHLEGIAISAFGTDDLLEYMAHRASYLRRLQISNCNGISNMGLEEFVKKFSLLEELDISLDKYLSKRSLEAIGRCCPSLKSLKLDIHYYFEVEFADQVFAIAKTMPGLRHLAFSGICIGNNELVAILDGCPLLDSLHLQNCVLIISVKV
ncbi:F-box protein SKIP19-like [Vicia villosa]|uniref:F-box protein SKIP19-like n=1 Tax=Vicia villosa TaxID=3911 RepID=UPI00273C4B8E|nr:F-box protein SKIP19-like [Vicia villosa]